MGRVRIGARFKQSEGARGAIGFAAPVERGPSTVIRKSSGGSKGDKAGDKPGIVGDAGADQGAERLAAQKKVECGVGSRAQQAKKSRFAARAAAL